MKEFNVVLAGVGGQGILLAAEILGTAFIKEGLNVRVSEIHGMAQRGGAVVSHVRAGDGVHAPTTPETRADIILGLEPLEALRNIKFASEKTLVLINAEKIVPADLSSQKLSYPSLQSIINQIRLFTTNIKILDAADLARKAGNILARNVVMIGGLAATGKLPINTESLKKAVHELVPSRYMKMNLKAFELGHKAI